MVCSCWVLLLKMLRFNMQFYSLFFISWLLFYLSFLNSLASDVVDWFYFSLILCKKKKKKFQSRCSPFEMALTMTIYAAKDRTRIRTFESPGSWCNMRFFYGREIHCNKWLLTESCIKIAPAIIIVQCLQRKKERYKDIHTYGCDCEAIYINLKSSSAASFVKLTP